MSIGCLLNDEKYRLVISRRNVQLIQGTLGRSYLRCSRYDMAQLLLGHVDVRDAIAVGRLAVSTRIAHEMAAALLPRLPFWRPPWDDMPAPALVVGHSPSQVGVQESLDATVEDLLETSFGDTPSGRP